MCRGARAYALHDGKMANKRTVQNGIDVGKPCPVSEEHFPGRENLARFPRDIFPGGKTLLGFRGTFPQAGKPCSVSEGHFPKRENLARFPRNISPDGKTLLGFRGTFSRAGKPCRAPQEHFPEQENLAALRGNISPGRETLPRSAATLLDDRNEEDKIQSMKSF